MMKRLGKVRIEMSDFKSYVSDLLGYKKQYIRNFKLKGR